MPSPIWTIARNTFTESIRQPLYLVLLLGTVLLLALNPALTAFAFDEENKLLIDLGLSTLFLSGLFLAAFTATGVFSREIENRTVLTVISKPVGRPSFVLGKYLGVAGAIAAAYWIGSAAFLMTVRHQVMIRASDPYDTPVLVFGLGALAAALGAALWANYFYGWVFSSTLTALLAPLFTLAYLLVLAVDKGWNFQPLSKDLDGQLLIALLLVFEALALLGAVAVAASVRLGQVMTLSVCTAVFLVGLSSDYLFGRFAEQSYWAAAAYAIFPNLQYFWQADALTQKSPIPFDHVAWVSGYCGLYAAGVLGLAVALFQTREVG